MISNKPVLKDVQWQEK